MSETTTVNAETGEITGPEVEVIQPDVVDPAEDSKPGVAVESAITHALANPELPGYNEFMALAMIARTLAESEIIPKALRNRPSDVLVVLLTARDLQIPATTALSQIHVIDGKPTLSPKLLSARVQRMGMGRIVQAYKSEEMVLAAAVEPGKTNLDPRCIAESVKALSGGGGAQHWVGDGGETCRCHGVIGFSSFSWNEAQQPTGRNRLVDEGCSPNNHKGNCKCKDNWRNYGASRMLWQRVRGYCADDWFPEASLGLYSPEELGAFVDEQGDPIDPSTVALPVGFERGAAGSRRPSGGSGDQAPADEIGQAEREDVADLIVALPDDLKVELRETWKSRDLLPLAKIVRKGDFNMAKALVNAQLAKARKIDGWDLATEKAKARTARTGEATPPPSSGTEGELPAEDEDQGDDIEPIVDDNPIESAAEIVKNIPEEIFERATRRVGDMTGTQVEAELRSRYLKVSGTLPAKRQRLAADVAREMQLEAQSAEHGAHDEG